ncbi:hypothetical protein OG724_18400 [[Kitasatospora] papulosa]|uniref:hypothetical protein n=1 Tax=[Kitasatospora] papulosa TaxID=1464011 RepID=UPI002E318081|nr:hypothetical protein [[Kitasatospora] papulosa]
MHPEGSAKLEKAEEFLLVADTALSAECFDASISLSVSASINGSDILCLEILGKFPTGKNHEDALTYLRRCGVIGGTMARHLQRVLKLKNKAQYSSSRCREKEAEDAYRHAERIIEGIKVWLKQNNRED